MFDLKDMVTFDISIKDGTLKFAESLTQQIFIAMQKSSEVYLNIALSKVHVVTGQLAQSGQIHVIEAKDTRNFSIPRFTFEVSFGRQPGSLTQSVVWRQTQDQQLILGRAPLEQDNRALATEFGFYAWEQPKPKAWRRFPYLFQGLPFIMPAIIETMRDWDNNISSSDLAESFIGGL